MNIIREVSYTCENLYSYTIWDEESEFTFTFPQKSTDNIFKMASLSVKTSIVSFPSSVFKNCRRQLRRQRLPQLPPAGYRMRKVAE